MPPPPGGDPFVSIMLALPRLLARRSSSDEPLQLHGIAYLATVARYCRQRTEMGVPGWSSNRDGESARRSCVQHAALCQTNSLPGIGTNECHLACPDSVV